MLRLQRIFKNYQETGAFNEQVNLYGFIDSNVFLTKSGELGVILEVRGVDYECLDGASIDGLTKRLESALKLFDENYRIQLSASTRNRDPVLMSSHGNPSQIPPSKTASRTWLPRLTRFSRFRSIT